MRLVLVGLSILCTFGGGMAAQARLGHATEPLTTAMAIEMYVRGDREVVARNAPAYLPPIWTIADDLGRLKIPAPADTGRAIAAFSLEAARELETQDPPTVCKIVGSTRSRWLKAGSKDEFTHRWHSAAIAVLLRGDCLPALDLEVTAAVADFPTDSRFRLARAIVAEQQLSAALADGRRPSGRELRDAETRFKIAMALPPAGEAALRWARVNALLGQHDQAVGLTADALASPDARLRYLAHLFRGWSLAALGKLDDADSEYGQALTIVPNAQSATLARAAAAFRNRHADRAEPMVTSLISRRESVEDPWWTYVIGDGRQVDQLIAELRQVIK